MSDKIKIELGKVQETLLLPLWGRAVESQKEHPRLFDRTAIEIIRKIDYDFSTIAGNISWVSQLAWVARSIHIDNAIVEFVRNNPRATIVNIGCGLDTTFERIDNGQLMFYELDLPDVIELRKHFFAEKERRKTISASFLDDRWLSQLQIENGVLFVAAGVFYYFHEYEIRRFVVSLANFFSGCDVVFDSASPLGVRVANKKVIRDGGMDEAAMLKWGTKDAGVIEHWDRRIHLVDEFPLFAGMKRGYPLRMKYGLWMSDFLRIMSMVHLRIGGVVEKRL